MFHKEVLPQSDPTLILCADAAGQGAGQQLKKAKKVVFAGQNHPQNVKKSIQMLFSAPMVLANLAGLKNQTRRRMNPQPVFGESGWSWKGHQASTEQGLLASAVAASPYGGPGTVARVKENCWVWCEKRPNGTTATGRVKWRYIPVGRHVVYAAEHPKKPVERIDHKPEHCWRLKVARFMPGWAVRLELMVEEVRLERLQDISEADALAEGIREVRAWDKGDGPAAYGISNSAEFEAFDSPVDAYKALWEQINGPESWSRNELVWVIRYSLGNLASLEGAKS